MKIKKSTGDKGIENLKKKREDGQRETAKLKFSEKMIKRERKTGCRDKFNLGNRDVLKRKHRRGCTKKKKNSVGKKIKMLWHFKKT